MGAGPEPSRFRRPDPQIRLGLPRRTGHEARVRWACLQRVGDVVRELRGHGAGYFANTLIEIVLEPGASLERIVRWRSRSTPSPSDQRGWLAAGSSFPRRCSPRAPAAAARDPRASPGAGAAAEPTAPMSCATVATSTDHPWSPRGRGRHDAAADQGRGGGPRRAACSRPHHRPARADRTDAAWDIHAGPFRPGGGGRQPELEIGPTMCSAPTGTRRIARREPLFYARSRGMRGRTPAR